MGIFSRMRDIISSNVNAMLDRAEDPEKMIRLMIQEMEDTLVEVKVSCAGAMAQRKKVEREWSFLSKKVDDWQARAEMALDRGRENMAREALMEKKRLTGRLESIQNELAGYDSLVDEYKSNIGQLEEKLAGVKERQRVLIQRHMQASQKMRAQANIRRASSSDAVLRFEEFENRVERMEAEADLVNPRNGAGLEERFRNLTLDEDVESELAQLKSRRSGGTQEV